MYPWGENLLIEDADFGDAGEDELSGAEDALFVETGDGFAVRAGDDLVTVVRHLDTLWGCA